MPGISVAVAIAVGLVSSFIQSFGLTIQRKSHVQEELLPLTARRRPIRRPLWLLGFVVYITSNVFSTIFQLDALPIVILAPLGAVSLIFNALLARLMLGDSFGSRSAAGTALVAIGAVLIAVFGVVPEEEHSLKELLRLWKRPSFLGFFGTITAVTGLVIIAAQIAAWHTYRQINRIALPTSPPPSAAPSNYGSPYSPAPIPFRPTNSRRWSSPVSSYRQFSHLEEDIKPSKALGVRFKPIPESPRSSIDERRPLIPAASDNQQRRLTLIGLAFAAASGVLSGMSLVLAKAAVELLIITIDHYRTGRGENQFAHAQSWLLVAGLGVGAILQLVYLNYSLTFASPALVCPLAFCFFNLSSIFDGLVFYDQFGRLAPYQIGLVSLGVAVLLLGVWVVSALQPDGDGGVDLGTWIEEDEGSVYDEPEEIDPMTSVNAPVSPTPLAVDTFSPRIESAPTTPLLPSSPTSPTSPISRYRHRHRTRYGTLIPELAPIGAPTGFSIGLGAASPGFVLRSEHVNHSSTGSMSTGYRRGRSRSEDPQGILAIMRGADLGVASGQDTRQSTGGRTEAPVEVISHQEQAADAPLEAGPSRFSWLKRWATPTGKIGMDGGGSGTS